MTTTTLDAGFISHLQAVAKPARIVDLGEGLPVKNDYLSDTLSGKLWQVYHIFEMEPAPNRNGQRWAKAYVKEVEWLDTELNDESECFFASLVWTTRPFFETPLVPTDESPGIEILVRTCRAIRMRPGYCAKDVTELDHYIGLVASWFVNAGQVAPEYAHQFARNLAYSRSTLTTADKDWQP